MLSLVVIQPVIIKQTLVDLPITIVETLAVTTVSTTVESVTLQLSIKVAFHKRLATMFDITSKAQYHSRCFGFKLAISRTQVVLSSITSTIGSTFVGSCTNFSSTASAHSISVILVHTSA